MLYYATYQLQCDCGIIITASHNPKNYNGAKFIVAGRSFGTSDIAKLGLSLDPITAEAAAKYTKNTQITEIYSRHLQKLASNALSDQKIVWDCGSGAMCGIINTLTQSLNKANMGRHIPVFATYDPEFKYRQPDPAKPEALQATLQQLHNNGANIAISFDGDGDRVVFVKPNGTIIFGVDLLIFIASKLLPTLPNTIDKTIIVDVKTSPKQIKALQDLGAKVVLSKTGHCIIKEQISLHNAILAAEVSGHIFINHNYYGFDDALYAALLALQNLPDLLSFSAISYPHSITKNIACPEHLKDLKIQKVIEFAQQTYPNRLNTLDGVRVELDDMWFLVRRSNTEPIVNILAQGNLAVDNIVNTLVALLK